jgi:DNA-binding SARP family transcriptional activator
MAPDPTRAHHQDLTTTGRTSDDGPMVGVRRSVLVGREQELSILCRAVDDAVAGHGSVWLLRGSPGIGKTRLATEAREYAQRCGAGTAHAFSWDQGGAPPFWPWRLAARGIGASASAPIAIGDVDVLPPDDRDRFRLFDDALAFLRSAATETPIVVVLDDLHEADLATILLLRFVAEGIVTVPMMVIGTYRQADLVQRPELGEGAAEHLEQAARSGGTVDLVGLRVDEVRSLLLDQTDTDHDAIDEGFVARVTTLSQGNPLFIQHLAPTLLDRRDDEGPGRPASVGTLDGDLPDSIRRVIHHRLEWLDPDARELLRVAAVAGADVEVTALAELSGRPADSIVERLSRTAELVFVTLDDDRLQFRHPLVRDALLDELDPAARAALHLRIAEWMERDVDRAAQVDVLAHHLLRAGAERAIDATHACAAAARRATETFAFEDAIVHLRRATDSLDRLAPLDRELSGLRADLLMELGRIYWRASRRPECDEAFDEAWELARSLDDADRLAEAALGGGFSKAFTTPMPNERARRCEVALERIGPAPTVMRSLLHAKLASELVGDLDPTRSQAAAAEALRIARQVGDGRAIGEALAAVLVNDLGPDRIDRRIELADEMLEIARRTSDLALAVQARFQLVGALVELGDRVRLEQVVADQHRTVHALAEPGFLRHDVWFRAMLATVDADLALAETLTDEGLAASGIAHDPDGALVWGGQLGVIRWMQGRVNELEPLYRDMAASSPEPVWSAVLAWLWARNGMLTAADGQLERVRAATLGAAPRDRNWLLAAVTAAEAAARIGRRDDVDGFIALLDPYRDHLVPIAMGISFWGTVARPLAMLHLARGDVDRSIAHHERAIEATARFGALAWLVESQLDLADVLIHRVGTPTARRRARELLDEAEVTARRCGLEESTARCRQLGARCTGESLLGVAEPGDLTGASIEVLGGFRCRDTAGEEIRWTSRRARALLKTLVAARGRRVSRDALIERLWPGEHGPGLANRLSVALSTVRRSLDPARRFGRDDLVGADRDTLWLVTSTVDVDLERFLDAASSAQRSYEQHRRGGQPTTDVQQVIDELQFAIGRYTGPAFADEPYDDVWSATREEARAAFVAACRAVATLATEGGATTVAADALRSLLDADPYDERAHLTLVELHRNDGSHGLAELAELRYRAAMAELSTPARSVDE